MVTDAVRLHLVDRVKLRSGLADPSPSIDGPCVFGCDLPVRDIRRGGSGALEPATPTSVEGLAHRGKHRGGHPVQGTFLDKAGPCRESCPLRPSGGVDPFSGSETHVKCRWERVPTRLLSMRYRCRRQPLWTGRRLLSRRLVLRALPLA